MLVNVPTMGSTFPAFSRWYRSAERYADGGQHSRAADAGSDCRRRQADGEGDFGAAPAMPPAQCCRPAANRNAAAPAPAAADGPAERLLAAQESSAGRAAPSVAEARRLHKMEKTAQDSDLAALMIRAQTAEEDGKPGVAKVYYQMVVKRASGDLKAQAQERLDALSGGASR